MSAQREELELVTDEATLRVGDIVVVKACIRCGSSHRMMLMRAESGEFRALHGDDNRLWSTRWKVAPEPWGHMPGWILASTISQRRLYRVRTGLEQSTETRKAVTA